MVLLELLLVFFKLFLFVKEVHYNLVLLLFRVDQLFIMFQVGFVSLLIDLCCFGYFIGLI